MEFFQRILSKRYNRIFFSSFISISKFHYLFLFFQFSIQFIVFKIFRNFECLIPSIGILHKSKVRIKINIFTLSGKRKSSNFLLILILDIIVKNLKSFLQDYTWLGVKKNLLREQTCSLERDRGGERGGGARLHKEEERRFPINSRGTILFRIRVVAYLATVDASYTEPNALSRSRDSTGRVCTYGWRVGGSYRSMQSYAVTSRPTWEHRFSFPRARRARGKVRGKSAVTINLPATERPPSKPIYPRLR